MSFSDERPVEEAGINASNDLQEKLLPHEAQKKKGEGKAAQRKALCASIFAMAISIPALIGA